MLSQTREALKGYNNQREFELMSADILNFWKYRHVRPIAPRGGADGGRDIEYLTDYGKKGLAWVTLRQDIEDKFKEDATKRQPGDYDLYILFCTQYLTEPQKAKFAKYCRDVLKAEFLDCDIEALRSILDISLPEVREKYLSVISDREWQHRRDVLARIHNSYCLLLGSTTGIPFTILSRTEPMPKEWVEQQLERLGERWRYDIYY